MTPQEIDSALDEISYRLERVRSLYEQYFMGIERTIPSIPKKDLDRRIEKLRKVQFNNTAKRFKFQTLVQRYTSLKQYWYRTCREIENGTYRKHLQKARRRFGEDEPVQDTARNAADEKPKPGATTRERVEGDLAALLDADVDLDDEMGNVLSQLENSASPGLSSTRSDRGDAAPRRSESAPSRGLLQALDKEGESASPLKRGATSPRPTLDRLPPLQKSGGLKAGPRPAPPPERPKAPAQPATPPAGKPATASGLSDERIRAIHERYQAARTQTKASAVSYEKLQKSIRETESQLRAKHRGKNVDFDVSIKNGKAILKPRLK